MKFILIILIAITPICSYTQSDIQNTLKVGELLVGGLGILKKANNGKSNSNFVESICIKNKMGDKIVFRLYGKNELGDDFNKELIVQNDSKECVFNLFKGVYNYEVILSNKEVYKKGEYKFDDEMMITIKKE